MMKKAFKFEVRDEKKIRVIVDTDAACEADDPFAIAHVCSWFDFAKIICELSGNTCDIQPCYSEEFPSPVKRPHFSVLDKSKLKQTFGFKVPYWTDSLKKCIAELAAAK